MRPYRGLTKEGNKWVYGWYAEEPTKGTVILADIGDWYDGPHLTEIEVIPETVGQQVGLKDKNGKGDEVYQDDIVSSFEGVKYLVYWDTEYGQWWARIVNKTKGKYTRSLCEILDNSYMHIIGNIHTTPKLMEQDNGE